MDYQSILLLVVSLYYYTFCLGGTHVKGTVPMAIVLQQIDADEKL